MQELQRRLDAGETTPLVPVPEVKRRTIAEEIETHLTAKRSEGLSPATLRKLKYQLGTFEQFLAARSKFFACHLPTFSHHGNAHTKNPLVLEAAHQTR